MVPNGTNYSYDGISRYLWYQGIQKWVAGVCWRVLVCAGVCWRVLVCAGVCWCMLVYFSRGQKREAELALKNEVNANKKQILKKILIFFSGSILGNYYNDFSRIWRYLPHNVVWKTCGFR